MSNTTTITAKKVGAKTWEVWVDGQKVFTTHRGMKGAMQNVDLHKERARMHGTRPVEIKVELS